MPARIVCSPMGTETGWELFAQADWEAARSAFAAALDEDPDDPDAQDGLGQSLWWLGRREEAIDRRREAYASYRRRGDARRAGMLATYLAAEHRIDGQHAEAAGWLARARRLLADAGTVPELGWLEIEEAKRSSDPVVAERHAQAALEVAHALSDPDVECMALAQLGRSVVRQGRVEDGLALLDEAMTVALGGETSDPLACGDACCTTLVVCDSLADLDRAAEWCAAVVEFTERRRFIPVQSWCRGIYAGVLVRAGDWERADGRPRRSARTAAQPRQAGRTGAAARRARRASSAAGPDGGRRDAPGRARRRARCHRAPRGAVARARRPRVRASVARPAAGCRRG